MVEPKMFTRQAKDRLIKFPARPLIMGVVNVTPDSFFDGGRYLDAATAVAHAVRLVGDRKSTRLNSSHIQKSRMPSSA